MHFGTTRNRAPGACSLQKKDFYSGFLPFVPIVGIQLLVYILMLERTMDLVGTHGKLLCLVYENGVCVVCGW